MDLLLLESLQHSNKYIKDDVAWFFSSKDQNYQLSNMCMGFPIQYNDVLWKSSEHLYQASKYGKDVECVPDTQKENEEVIKNVRERIRQAKQAMASKMTQKCAIKAGLVRSDWDTQCFVNMLFVLELKLFYNEEFLKALQATKNKEIVEMSRKDSLWGCVPRFNQKGTRLVGRNALGKLLMNVRSRSKEIVKGKFTEPVNFFI